MTQTAMIRGLARWAGKNMETRLTEGGLARIGFGALTRIAESNPMLALKMALIKYPSVAPIVAAVTDAGSFDAAVNAISESVVDNGCLTIDIKEPPPLCKVQTFRINRADIDDIRDEMERAYKEELAAAKAVEAAGQKS